jgi:YfiH family protein
MAPLRPSDFWRGPLPVPHGFSPRHGGVSADPFATLNLGLSVGDDPSAVAINRGRVAAAFGFSLDRVVRLNQVHGTEVVRAIDGVTGREGDALVSDDPRWLLAISAADCLSVLMLDHGTGAVAAAHAGWRGLAAGVVRASVERLTLHFGSDPARLQVWLGPAIQGPCYQVGPEVAAAVLADPLVPADVLSHDPQAADRYRLDVPAAVTAQLLGLGVPAAAISASEVCTHCHPGCYSHRRDGRNSGRHWAVVRARG